MTELMSALYQNPSSSEEIRRAGGIRVVRLGRSDFPEDDLTQIKRSSLEGLSTAEADAVASIVPFQYSPIDLTAVAFMPRKVVGEERDYAYGFASIRPELRGGAVSPDTYEFSSLYVAPSAPRVDLRELQEQGVGAALVHFMLRSLNFDDLVKMPHMPNIGKAESQAIIRRAFGYGLVNNKKHRAESITGLRLDLFSNGVTAGTLMARLEHRHPWLQASPGLLTKDDIKDKFSAPRAQSNRVIEYVDEDREGGVVVSMADFKAKRSTNKQTAQPGQN